VFSSDWAYSSNATPRELSSATCAAHGRATFHGVSVDPRGCERAVGEHGGDRRTGLWLRRARLAYAAEDVLYALGARGGDDGSGS
jgi:hypothetical protein